MYLIVTILLLKLNQEESTSHSSRWCTRRMALDCNEMNGQEGSSRSTEESEGVYEQGRIQEGREEIEETPDPTHKQVTPHTREDQSEDQPSSGISRVKESVQQICLISYTILQLLYIYMLEDPDVVELLLQLLTQLWRFIKWSFVIVTDILERTVLYHVDHIRLSPSLSRFAKKIFCQQKSYSRLSVEETDSYIDLSGKQTEKERNVHEASEGGEEPSRPTHRWINQTQPLDQTLSEIWRKLVENFQQMYLILCYILHPICKHFLQDLDVVDSLLLLTVNFWRCLKWAVILVIITYIYILFCCAHTVLSVCSSLLGLREKIFHRVKKPLQETAGDTSEDLRSIVIHV
ncbi:uncharacterized protein LOC122929100 isoform X2 [Bufo gargarizans]|uniref:uncharacterized protein LOC122929100 isoform X2 n=1 Tax=Bufo gargarizans TaxID=30331 RepID=UPI001CF5DFE2|nr:uncharacterized protein LOC122929100 isoform X2 [Bufo gargarizans]